MRFFGLAKSTLCVIFAMILLIVAGFGLTMTTNEQQASGERASHLMAYRNDIDKYFLSIDDAEASMRGLLLTRNSDYLKPYNRAIAAVRQNVKTLERDVVDDDDIEVFDTLHLMNDRKLDSLAGVVSLAQQGRFREATLLVSAPGWWDQIYTIRRLCEGLRSNNLEDLGLNREKTLRQSKIYTATVLSMLIASMLLFGTVIYAMASANAALVEQSSLRDAAEKQLRQSQKMEAVGQLTGGLAHDLNNMLMGVIGMLDLIERQAEKSDYSRLPKYLSVARDSADRAGALTHRLLAFSRRAPLAPEPVAPCALVQDMTEFLRRTIGPQVEITVNDCSNEWTTLVDKSALENALLNLCLNSRDAMPGGGSITIDIHVKTFTPDDRDCDFTAGEYVVVSVADSGTGMDEQTCARIFEPFFTTKAHGHGTGLGLSQVYGFAKQSGGQVRVRSSLGVGTTIDIWLPRDLSVKPFKLDDYARIETGRGRTVLLVDDEPAIRNLLYDALCEQQYNVVVAKDGQEALTLAATHQIDLLLTDIGMPGLDGRELADRLRGQSNLPVIFMTGFAPEEALSGPPQAGVQAITKPFKIERLLEQITACLA